MKDTNSRFATAKTLTPKQVARVRSDLKKTYIFYGQVSSDAVHPSVSALNRYAVPEITDEAAGVDMDPIVSDRELAETVEYLCMAAIGVCVAVNQIIGGAPGAVPINGIAERYVGLSDRTKAEFTSAP
jgi:hypothetical protein